jgi:predicted transcriptional regulator
MKLGRLEIKVMDALWARGPSSVRDVQEQFPEAERPAYTTVQTMLYRLERKKAVRRIGKVGHAHLFEAVISEASAQHRLIDDLLGLLGGRTQPLMVHLIDSGKLTIDDLRAAEKRLEDLKKKGKTP